MDSAEAFAADVAWYVDHLGLTAAAAAARVVDHGQLLRRAAHTEDFRP